MYITVKLHDAVLERPKVSGDYYCITAGGQHMVLPYSVRQDRFNASDRWPVGVADPIRVNWWAELLQPERGGEFR